MRRDPVFWPIQPMLLYPDVPRVSALAMVTSPLSSMAEPHQALTVFPVTPKAVLEVARTTPSTRTKFDVKVLAPPRTSRPAPIL